MKKTFKRTIACLLAVLMVISSLPFTVFAEDNSVQPVVDDGVGVTCDVKNYGVFTDLNGGSDRFKADNWIDIANDGTSDTFTIGYINFDISGIKASEFDEIHGDFTLRHRKYQYEYTSLQVMYPTQNQGLFDNQTSVPEGDKLNATAFNSIWKDGVYAQNAKEYFGLEKIGTFTYDAYMSSSKDDTIDVGPAIQQALKAGLDYATVVFLLANEDSNGKFVDGESGSYWTDTYIYFNNLTVKRVFNFKATESTTVQKPASLNENTANTAPKTGTSNYSIGGVTMPAEYSNNVLYCSSTTEANKTYKSGHYVRRISVTPLNSVLMYDGSGINPAMPIMFGFQPSYDCKSNLFLCNAYLDWESANFKSGQFTGCKPLKATVIDKDRNTPYTSNFIFDDKDTIDFTKIEDKDRVELSTDSNTYETRYSFTINEYPVANGACYFWNKMEFYGGFNENGGFKKFQNPNVSIGIRNKAGGVFGSSWQNVSEKTYPQNANIYVLNYKPIYDVLSNNEAGKVSTLGGNYTFKDLYNKVWANEKEFSPAAVNRYYSAVEKLVSIDPQAELANCADDQVESKVKELGVKIKTAYSRYVSAAKDLEYKVDWNAYNDADTLAATALNQDRAQYTEASITEFEKIVNKVRPLADAARNQASTKQADIDNFTSQLLSALSMLRKKSVTITYRVFKNKEGAESEESKTYSYGESVDYSYTCAPGESITAWTVRDEINHAYTRVGTSEANFSLVATRDLSVEVYVTTKQVSTAEFSKVTFIGPGGNIIDIKYVEKDKPLDKSEFPKAPKIPFYTFNNSWSTEDVTGTGKDIKVYASYSVDSQKCRVHFNNNEFSYNYDKLVELDGYDLTKKYALAKDAEGKNIITYLDRDSFHAPRTDNIYVVEVENTKAKIGITGNFGDTDTDSERRKLATYNCKFYLPAGCTAVEWGLEINNGKTIKQAQSNVQNDYNEYSVTVRYKSTSTVKKITCRAYLTYKTSDQYVTIYSDHVEQAISTL